MPVPAVARPSVPVFTMLPMGMLQESSRNPRRDFDAARLSELTASVQAHGVLTPLIVREVAPNRFEIGAGHRRFRAAQLAGLAEVPVLVHDLDDQAFLELMVIDNLERQDVSPLEEAEGFKALMTFGFDLDALTARIHRTRGYVYDRIKLLDLIEPARALLARGLITPAHAIRLARLTASQQSDAIDVAVRGSYGPVEGPLFVADHGLLALVDDAKPAKEADPYAGLKVRSVREFDAWIATHCRFVPEAPVNVELFPETTHAIAEAEKVIAITHSHHVNPEAKDGGRILGPNSWVRADGAQKSKTCAHSVLGVFVIGPEYGQARKVCANKDACDVHWGQQRREKAKAAKAQASGKASAGKTAPAVDYEAERRKEEAERQAWVEAGPVVLAALAKKVDALPITKVGAELLNDLREETQETLRALLPAPKTAAAVLRFLLMAGLVEESAYWNRDRFAETVQALLKVDVLALAREAARSEKSDIASSQAKSAKKAKKR